MSLSDLEKMKLLRPKEEWTGQSAKSQVRPLAASVVAAFGVAGCIMMMIGNGGSETWVGLLMFSTALALFTWINLNGIYRKTS